MSKHRTFKQFYEDMTVDGALISSDSNTNLVTSPDSLKDTRIFTYNGTYSRKGKVTRKKKRKTKKK